MSTLPTPPSQVTPTAPVASAAPAPTTHRSSVGGQTLRVAAIAMVLITAIMAGTLIYIVHTASKATSALAASSTLGMGSAIDRMFAFLKGDQARMAFFVNAQKINGSNYLQFATLNEETFFDYTDPGNMVLPDVTLIARAPVEYTYYLDLQGAWRFEVVDDKVLRVFAPEVQHNKPSVDISKLKYFVTEGSILRNETKAKERFQTEIMQKAGVRARRNIRFVRGEGRTQVEKFVRTWLQQDFPTVESLRIEVYFPGEEPPASIPATPTGPTIIVPTPAPAH